jgi:hypothetical protein
MSKVEAVKLAPRAPVAGGGRRRRRRLVTGAELKSPISSVGCGCTKALCVRVRMRVLIDTHCVRACVLTSIPKNELK